jgi:hypothetical protein
MIERSGMGRDLVNSYYFWGCLEGIQGVPGSGGLWDASYETQEKDYSTHGRTEGG